MADQTNAKPEDERDRQQFVNAAPTAGNRRPRRTAVAQRRRSSFAVVLGTAVGIGLIITLLGCSSKSKATEATKATRATRETGATGSPIPARTKDVEAKAAPPTTAPSRAVDPSQFMAGACEEFRPTSGNVHKTVFLDAGHGGIDPGGVGKTESGQTIYEATETLPVELDAMAMLRADGYTVVISRIGNTSVAKLDSSDVTDNTLTVKGSHDDVAARDICANVAGADLLVGIYFDAGSSASNAGSVTGYDAVRSFSAQNLHFANLLQSDVLTAMNDQDWDIPDGGVLSDNGLGSLVTDGSGTGLSAEAASYGHLLELGPAMEGYFTTPSQMPGAVIEPLYLTDPVEGTLAASPNGQHTIASGIAQAVEQDLTPPPATPTPGRSPSAPKHPPG